MTGIPENPEQLLRERAWLVALARQLVRGERAAEEAAHDAMVAAALQSAPRTAGPRAWLAAILRKQLAGRRRADESRTRRERSAARGELLPAAADTVVRFETQREVADAVLALAEPYRTTLLLRFWDGLSPRAIARRLGVPVETVRTRQKRALAMLRERFDRTHGGDRRAWMVALLLAARPQRSAMALVGSGVLMMTISQKLALSLLGAATLLVVPWLAITLSQASSAPTSDAPQLSATAVAIAGDAASERSTTSNADVPPTRVAAPAASATRLEVVGRLVDADDGTAIVGASVQRWPLAAALPATTTDTAGAFVLACERGRDVQMLLVAADRAPLRVRVPVAEEPPVAGIERIDVGDLRVHFGTRYRGRVVDAEGRRVGDAELMLSLSGLSSWSGYGREDAFEETLPLGRSAADGSFALAMPIAPSGAMPMLVLAVSPAGIGWAPIEPTARRRDVDDLSIVLRREGELAVVVATADGRPCAGAVVHAQPGFSPLGILRGDLQQDVGGALLRPRFVGRTDANGRCNFRLPIGDPGLAVRADMDATGRGYRVWVEAEGHVRQASVAVAVEPGAVRRLDVRLVDVAATAVVITVRDDRGLPIADAHLAAVGDGVAETRSDANGHAEVTVPARGDVRVAAHAPGHRRCHATATGAIGAPLTLELVMQRTQRLSGRVVDQFGEPAPEMGIALDGELLATTAADGSFESGEFPVGRHRIVVSLPNTADLVRWTGEHQPEFVDAAAGPVTIVVERRPGRATVRIAVVDAETGAALEPATARLGLRGIRDMFALAAPVKVEAGVVTAVDVPAGEWRLDVRCAEGRRGSLRFPVAVADERIELRLPLQRPGTVQARLRFVGMEPTATAEIRVQHATVDPTAFVDFCYPGVWPAGDATHRVDVEAPGPGKLVLQPAIDPGFRLEHADPTAEIEFVVRVPGGEGRARVRVRPGAVEELSIDVRPSR